MLSYPLSYNNFIVLTGFKREKKNEIGINKNILIYFVAERYIFPSENSRKNIGIWVIERSRWYVEYVCSMNVCQLDCVAKKVTIKTNDDDKLHFHNDVFYYTARVHTRIDSPGTLKFPLLSLALNLATVFWSQRWWHTDKQQYRFIVKFANLIFLGSS